MSFLRVESITKRFGAVSVIKNVTIAAEKGEFVVFVGPSGCGKSTLLRMIAGLEESSSGHIFIDNEDVIHADPVDRRVAMVFQSYALFPHLNVYDNIAFGMQINKVPKTEIERRVKDAARILQIEPLLDRKPRQLSGGQRQRVAIGRAIVRNPKLFLFDEPLSNLDAELRAQMRVEIARLHRDIGATMVYVTHDQVEAMTLADRIVVLRAGIVEQVGSPIDLYDNPANVFVAGFVGSPKMNFVTVTVDTASEAEITVLHPSLTGGCLTLPGPFRAAPEAGTRIVLGLRPESLHIDNEHPMLEVAAEITENLGGSTLVHARTPEGGEFIVLSTDRLDVTPGARIKVSIRTGQPHLFDAEGINLRK